MCVHMSVCVCFGRLLCVLNLSNVCVYVCVCVCVCRSSGGAKDTLFRPLTLRMRPRMRFGALCTHTHYGAIGMLC